MNEFELIYKPYGERSILIEWPSEISRKVLLDVQLYKEKLKTHLIKEKVYIKHAYNSILITYDITINNFYHEVSTLKDLYLTNLVNSNSISRLWKIPVCYNVEFGLDLEEISTKNGVDISEIITLHTNRLYDVYFLGFLPGFLYLGGLDKQLFFPRKETPRLKVEVGSVAIGASQTGIYPTQSPGGWNIIGKTPIKLFDINEENPCFAKAGDKIKFISVSKTEYDQILEKVKQKTYILKSEVIND